MTLKPGLYVAATPIGNLADASFRLIDTLKGADLILCEDTRQTGKLCAAYGVDTRRAPYHDHNAASVRPGIIDELKAGARICLVSDAGTPLISDPGYKLVADARAAGVEIFALPGPCAAIAALMLAGAPTDRFLFAGFPPAKLEARRRWFSDLAGIDATLVIYESAARLGASLADAAAAMPGRRAAVARELTKLFEEVVDAEIEALAAQFQAAKPKGEIVVVIHPPEAVAVASNDAIDDFLSEALQSMSLKDAVAAASDALGAPRKLVYDRALSLRRDGT